MKTILALAMLLAPGAGGLDPPAWREPAAPVHLIGPIWDVGSKGLAAYLIKTPDGAILLDGTLAENVPGIERNLAAIGVPLRSIEVLLNSHAHFDHAGGLAQLKRDTGARLAAMDADVPALETGRPPSETSYGLVTFPAVAVDRMLHDGDTVRLGGVVLTAFRTPGHTPGCTTWAMPLRDGARTLRVLFPCSITVGGNRLVGNRGYPGIVADFRGTFARLAGMKADVVLTAHPEVADVVARAERRQLVDRTLLTNLVERSHAAFEAELAGSAPK